MKFFLNLTVFLTGACVLAIELLWMRVLAPYFGNTIYTTSGTITVILLALSLGYQIGGYLADRHPHPTWFYSAIALGSGLILFTHLATQPTLTFLSHHFSIMTGPLLATLILIFLPSLVFGALSPFAIKLQTQSLSSSGRTAGGVYFWSTLGSLAGSLASTFLLIPTLGIDTSFRLIYLVLFIISALGLLSAKHISTSLTLIATTFFINYYTQTISTWDLTHSKVIEGVYEKILITDIKYKDRPTRILTQNTNSSAGMFLNSSDLVFDYTKYITLAPKNADSALSLGAGGYSIPKWLHQTFPNMQIDVVEIEPKLLSISQKYFALPDTPKIRTFIDDGRHFLLQNQQKYSIIVIDMYSSRLGIPSHLATKEFFQLLSQASQPNSFILFNFIGNPINPNPVTLSQINTLRQVFPDLALFAVDDPHSNSLQNIMVIPNFSTPPKPWSDHQFSYPETLLASGQILTDNLNPTDLLYAKYPPR